MKTLESNRPITFEDIENRIIDLRGEKVDFIRPLIRLGIVRTSSSSALGLN